MEESMIPSLSSGAIGSRFVSQDDVDTAKASRFIRHRARRDEQWKAAYARLGMEPPPQQQEDAFDGRSLAEKLAANKARTSTLIAKQEEWEEKTKLANQFRALEEDEIMFLDSVRERQEEEERQRKEKDGVEVQNFKE
ncbi:N-terminal domain of NEFA-interacting nuclear protein NIP30-domain-containing protein, partial [Mycena sp. CBHHK59/15]